MADTWPQSLRDAAEVYLYIEEHAVETGDGLVFTGTMTDVRKELGIARGSWGPIKSLLQDSVPVQDENGIPLSVAEPCLTLLRRGGGSQPSEWLINRPFTELDLAEYNKKNISAQGLTSVGGADTVVGEAGERLAELENEVIKIKMILQNFESRIRELEA